MQNNRTHEIDLSTYERMVVHSRGRDADEIWGDVDVYQVDLYQPGDAEPSIVIRQDGVYDVKPGIESVRPC